MPGHRRARLGATLAGLIAAAMLGPSAVAYAAPLAVGDSVMIGAEGRLEARGFTVNARTSRQVDDGLDFLRQRKAAGALPGRVVVHLGTNGLFTRAQCADMRRIVGPDRRLYLLTVTADRVWVPTTNRAIRYCADRYRSVRLIDWKRASAEHRSWFASDGFHLTSSGARAYARLIDRSV